MAPEARTRRIFVTGRMGSGKSTVALALGRELSLPVHDLDLVYRAGGGNGAVRREEQRNADLRSIAQSMDWVVEGVHLDGTEPLMERAEAIVWLDHISTRGSQMRIVRRFISGALHDIRHERGRRRFFRLGDYARHLRELRGALPEAAGYATDDEVSAMAVTAVTRRELSDRLSRFESKVIRCTSERDVAALVSRLRQGAATAR